MLKRSVLRQIRSSFGRYFAIFAIIALGVGFFSGLRVSSDAFIETVDGYLTECNLYHYRLISTLGLTEEDVEAFSSLSGVVNAEGSRSADLMYVQDSGSDGVTHVHSLPSEINQLDLRAGRLPEADNECVLDERFGGEEWIGQQIVLSADNPDETADTFTYDAYTVVGVVASPLYIHFNRGSTSLGSGDVSLFMYIPSGGFTTEYYTEIYLTVETDGIIYSDAFNDAVDSYRDAIEAQMKEQAELRYLTLHEEAEESLSDARAELEDAEATYRLERADAEAELADAKEQLEKSREQLDTGKTDLETGKAELAEQRSTAETELAEAEEELRAAQNRLTSLRSQIDSLTTLCTQGNALLNGLNRSLGMNIGSVTSLLGAASSDATLAYYIRTALAPYGMTETEFSAAWTQAESAIGMPLSDAALTSLEAQYAQGERTLTDSRKTLEEKRTEVNSALETAEQNLADAEAELLDGEAAYADGLAEYEEAAAEAETQFAEAEAELADAEAKLADGEAEAAELQPATTYVLDRSSNVGYSGLQSDSEILTGISRVFPLFFFLVAALVCITTMTRMVDEQRTQNGVLKALGFTDGAIIGQYLFYAGSASVLGSICGFLLGSKFLPMVLWEIYHIMYAVYRPVAFVLNWPLFALCLTLFLFCGLGATWFVCHKDLREVPAEMIRPKSQPAGKRIWIENIRFLWKRVPFLHKVSIRNILRFKKRMIMMILGIGGCTALLLTGFGIRNSIKPIVDFQYNEIECYDGTVSFLEAPDDTDRETFREECGDLLEDTCYVYSGEMTAQCVNGSADVTVISYETSPDSLINLHDGETPIAWPGPGETVVNRRLAESLDIQTGDMLELYDADWNCVTVTVSAVYDNYIYDILYVDAETFRNAWGSAPEAKTLYFTVADESSLNAVRAGLLNCELVASVSINNDMRELVGGMLQSMDYVVLIVLVCAGALAAIVLYNLTNISIMERIREISTLKVLGFYAGETAAYVFREQFVLTGISALIGLPMGIALHWYVMKQIKISMCYFAARIEPISYLYALILTFVFAAIVSFFLYGKLEKINMAESLKTIE